MMAEDRRRDLFLEGNELIEKAIDRYHTDSSKENLVAVLDAIRQRMHADGHLIFPIIRDEDNAERFAFRSITTGDGKHWHAAFTSQSEYGKGAKSEIMTGFIGSMLKNSLKTKTEGIIINPWGRSFMLKNELIDMMFKADAGVEYTVPDDDITEELLEDGSFLKRATEICNRNRTQLNLIKLARILRDSWVWVPCNAIIGDADQEAWSKAALEAAERGDLHSLVGQEFISHDSIRLVPDILKNGDDFFFPVFTSEEEMGEYGEHFSKVAKHFLEAATLARNNEKDVKGIVINPFTEPFIVPKEMFNVIARMDSSTEE